MTDHPNIICFEKEVDGQKFGSPKQLHITFYIAADSLPKGRSVLTEKGRISSENSLIEVTVEGDLMSPDFVHALQTQDDGNLTPEYFAVLAKIKEIYESLQKNYFDQPDQPTISSLFLANETGDKPTTELVALKLYIEGKRNDHPDWSGQDFKPH